MACNYFAIDSCTQVHSWCTITWQRLPLQSQHSVPYVKTWVINTPRYSNATVQFYKSKNRSFNTVWLNANAMQPNPKQYNAACFIKRNYLTERVAIHKLPNLFQRYQWSDFAKHPRKRRIYGWVFVPCSRVNPYIIWWKIKFYICLWVFFS